MDIPKIIAKISKAFAASENNDFSLEDNLIMLCRVGSVSQNTNLQLGEGASDADLDIRGVIVPPANKVLGLKEWTGWQWQGPAEDGLPSLDVELWSIERFMELALKGNPTVLEWVWLRQEDYLVVTECWKKIDAQKNIFSSKASSQKFLGMARSQLMKLSKSGEGKHVEEHDFQQIQEKLEQWEIPLEDVIQGRFLPTIDTNMGSFWKQDQLMRLQDMMGRYRRIYQERENQDPSTTKHATAKMGEKRKAMVEKFGWDVKNATHLLRVLIMAEEFLRTGILTVYREKDGEFLKSIKRGERSMEEVKVKAEELFKAANLALETSPLPEKANWDQASKILEEIYRESYNLGMLAERAGPAIKARNRI